MSRPTPETDAELHGINAVCKEERKLDAMTSHARKLERERDEAMELLASEKITRNHIIKRSVEVEKERDEAREAVYLNQLWAENDIGKLIKQLNKSIFRRKEAERERDEANEELNKKYIEYDKLFDEAELIRTERDQILQALMKIEEIFIDGEDTYDDWLAMGKIARATLESLNQQ